MHINVRPFTRRFPRPGWFLAAAAVAVTLVAAGGQAQTPAPASAARGPIDVAKLGPQVGDQVPNFTLTDQNGKAWTRQSIAGPKGAMLVFIRSADW